MATRRSPVTGSPGRARRRAARSDAFLDAAMRIVARDGVDGLTMAVLADELGAAKGALYRYFAGKDDLLPARQVRARAALSPALPPAAAGRGPLAPLGPRPSGPAHLTRVVDVIAVPPPPREGDPPRYRLL